MLKVWRYSIYSLVILIFGAIALADPPATKANNNEERGNYDKHDTNYTYQAGFILEFITGSKNIADYCNNNSDSETNKWSHGYICDVKITDVYVATFTALLTFVTIGLVLAGIFTINTMRATERRQLRAYLGIATLAMRCKNLNSKSYTPATNIVPRENEDFLVIEIKNFGQTPANYARAWVNWAPMEYLHRLPDDFTFEDADTVQAGDVRPIFSEATIFPDQSIKLQVIINDLTPFRNAVGKRASTYVWGHIDYDDIYGKGQITTFCYMYNPFGVNGEDFTPYEKHNQAK
jgi:hypothetical protein